MTYNEIKRYFIDKLDFSLAEWTSIIEDINGLVDGHRKTKHTIIKDKRKITIENYSNGTNWYYSVESLQSTVPIDWFAVSEVKIDLLTIEEAEQINSRYLASNTEWWLKSWVKTSNHPKVCTISATGVVNERGMGTLLNYLGVRPCFRIEGLDKAIGTKILVGNTWATVVLPGVALADYVVHRHRFDEYSPHWETSELKAYIESDKFKYKIANGDTI